MSVIRRTAAAYRAAFADLDREVWWLAAGLLVNRAGTMVLPFLTLYLTVRLDLAAATAGRLVAMYGVGSMVGSYVGGWLCDRLPPLRVALLSLVGSGAAYLVLGSVHGVAAVGTAILVAAAVADAFRPSLMVAVAHASTPATRPRAFALVRLAANLGMAIGPAVGGLLAAHHYRWIFIGDAMTCWAAALFLTTVLGTGRPQAVDAPPHHDRSAGSPWRDTPFVLFLILVVVLGGMVFQAFTTLPLDLHTRFGLPESAIGAVIGLNALLIALFEMVLLRSLERRDRLLVAAWGGLLIGGGLALLATGSGLVLAVASTVVWTLGEMLALPVSNAVVADRSPAGGTGRYMGAYTLAFALAFVLSPILGTAVYDRLGPRVLWLLLGLGGVALWLGFTALSGRLGGGREREARG